MSTEGRQINKSAIRNFAIEARNILIRSAITEAGFYGITKEMSTCRRGGIEKNRLFFLKNRVLTKPRGHITIQIA